MTEIYIGILSGTSMDAIDVAAIDFSTTPPSMIATHSYAIPKEFKQSCMSITNSEPFSIANFGKLDHWAGELFANAILALLEKFNLDKTNIIAVGSHGQTIWHSPNTERPFTIQIGDPNIIAHKTGITTVADFRRADMAAGGQGAPLAPVFHQGVFASPNEIRCILNVGGISNISILHAGQVFGYDTGPGNCLMDAWVNEHYKIAYDKDAEIAQTGTIAANLLQECLADPYFKQANPKSTGREYFNLQWLKDKLNVNNLNQLPANDVLATLVELTCRTITDAIQQSAVTVQALYICGGGAHNPLICSRLSKLLNIPVHTTEVLGIDPDWVEAALFAWLAQQRINSHTINTTSITGAKQPVILGGIYAAC